jgi:hypothetical protein
MTASTRAALRPLCADRIIELSKQGLSAKAIVEAIAKELDKKGKPIKLSERSVFRVLADAKRTLKQAAWPATNQGEALDRQALDRPPRPSPRRHATAQAASNGRQKAGRGSIQTRDFIAPPTAPAFSGV